jgi:hypothetical protein
MREKFDRMSYVLLTMIFVGALIIVGLVVRDYKTTCHGECGHGNRACQNRCLDKGVCPYGDQ